MQRVLQGAECTGMWAGHNWTKSHRLFVAPSGKHSFCVGQRKSGKYPGSKILPRGRCDGPPGDNGQPTWSHVLSFGRDVPSRTRPSSVLLCLASPSKTREAIITEQLKRCQASGFAELVRFPVRASELPPPGGADGGAGGPLPTAAPAAAMPPAFPWTAPPGGDAAAWVHELCDSDTAAEQLCQGADCCSRKTGDPAVLRFTMPAGPGPAKGYRYIYIYIYIYSVYKNI